MERESTLGLIQLSHSRFRPLVFGDVIFLITGNVNYIQSFCYSNGYLHC